MVTINDVVLDAADQPVPNAVVLIDLLVGPKPGGVGFLPGQTIAEVAQLTTDANGGWTVDLAPNSTIEPSGTVYRIRYAVGRDASYAIIVPASGGPYHVRDILATVPAAGPAPVIAARNVTYDNTLSGLGATNVQDAIDEGGGGGGGGAITLSGDVSGHPTSTSVDKVKGIPVAGTRGVGKGLIDDGTNLVFTDVATQAELDAEAATRLSADTTNADAITAEATARGLAVTGEANARIAADALLVPLTQKGAVSGVASLDGGGRVPAAQLPSLVLSHTYVVGSQAAMLALSQANTGDLAVRTDNTETFILSGADPTQLGNWTQLLFPGGGAVSSVNTRTGAVTGLAEQTALDTEVARAEAAESANATAISTETSRAQNAEALLAPKASPTFTGTVAGVSKSMVGLGNVDNTSDANKPVSTAQAAADALRMLGLTRTTVKTATGYTIVSGDLVPCDTTTGSQTHTLPTAAGGAIVAVKHVIQGGSNTVTVACAGSDVFNKSGGATTLTLPLLAQGVLLIGSSGIWTIVADDLALAQLDGRYLLQSGLNTPGGAQGYDTGLDAVRKALGGATLPQSSFDRFRATPRPKATNLNGAISDTTSSTVTVYDSSFTTAGKPELIEIVDAAGTTERCLAILGLGTTALICQRGADGTTPVTHLDGCVVRKAGVSSTVVVADSTGQGTVSPPFTGWVERLRQVYDDRFGGSLGWGFVSLWRDPAAIASYDRTIYPGWGTSGSFTLTPATSRAWYGLFGVSASASGSTSNFKRLYLTGQRCQQVDILSLFASGINNDWSYRYSWDNLVTFSSWANDPQQATYPVATTLLVADNGRALSYWDGTKTMAVAATANMKSCGYVQLTIATGQIATFSYQGIASSTSLSNVALVSGDPTWTSATGQTVNVAAQVKTSHLTGFVDNSGNPVFPTHIEIRAAKADGTATGTAGLWIGGAVLWDIAPTFGVTTGRMLHNFGRDGASLAEWQNADTWDDFATTNASKTVTTTRAVWSTTDIGRTIIHPNLPAGTWIESINSTTSVQVSANATATGTAVGTVYGTNYDATGRWASAFDGGSGSFVPDLCIVLDTNAMDGVSAARTLGGDKDVTGSITGGTLTLTVGTLAASDVGKVIAGAGVTAGTFISAFTDSTHATVSGMTTLGSTVLTVQQLSATNNTHIQNTMGILEARIGGYCDTFYLAPFEQGGLRLDGTQATAATQQSYRTAITTKAAALGRPSFDVYNNWVTHGITGFTQATTALYMVGASSPFHETDLGYRDMAASISRILEFA